MRWPSTRRLVQCLVLSWFCLILKAQLWKHWRLQSSVSSYFHVVSSVSLISPTVWWESWGQETYFMLLFYLPLHLAEFTVPNQHLIRVCFQLLDCLLKSLLKLRTANGMESGAFFTLSFYRFWSGEREGGTIWNQLLKSWWWIEHKRRHSTWQSMHSQNYILYFIIIENAMKHGMPIEHVENTMGIHLHKEQ